MLPRPPACEEASEHAQLVASPGPAERPDDPEAVVLTGIDVGVPLEQGAHLEAKQSSRMVLPRSELDAEGLGAKGPLCGDGVAESQPVSAGGSDVWKRKLLQCSSWYAGVACLVIALGGFVLPVSPVYAHLLKEGNLWPVLNCCTPSGLVLAQIMFGVSNHYGGQRHRQSYESIWPSVVIYVAVSVLSLLFFSPVVVELVDAHYSSWDPAQNRGRSVLEDSLMWIAYYAGIAALVPMSLLGIPLSYYSSLFSAFGLSHEQYIAYHRGLGHMMLSLLSFHSVGYMVAWGSASASHLYDELTDWADCGFLCGNIVNTAGLISWTAGLGMWISSLERVRRSNYAVFFQAHHLHFVFFAFACVHWPGIVGFMAPALILHIADRILRRNIKCDVVAVMRSHGTTELLDMVSLVFPASAISRLIGCKGDISDCLGSTVRLSVPSLERGCRHLDWHPFTVTGALDQGNTFGTSHLIVNISVKARWTHELARRTSAGLDCFEAVQTMGPLPAAAGVQDVCWQALAGTPILLIGAGSGLAPVCAILRKIAHALSASGETRNNSSCNVALVCIVRHHSMLEILDSEMLPMDESGATQWPWLTTELHVTHRCKMDENNCRDPCSDRLDNPRLSPQSKLPSGLFRLHVDGTGQAVATEAPFDLDSGPRPMLTRSSSVVVQEAVILLGSLFGYMLCSSLLLYSWPMAVPYHAKAPTVLVGALGLLAVGTSTYLGGYASSWLHNYYSHKQQGEQPDVETHSQMSAGAVSPGNVHGNGAAPASQLVTLHTYGSRPDIAVILDRLQATCERFCHGDTTEQPMIGSADDRNGEQHVHLNGLQRVVAAGGPENMLDQILKLARAPVIRLTYSL